MLYKVHDFMMSYRSYEYNQKSNDDILSQSRGTTFNCVTGFMLKSLEVISEHMGDLTEHGLIVTLICPTFSWIQDLAVYIVYLNRILQVKNG